MKAKPSSEHDDGRFALACLDISTGEFRLTECDRVRLAADGAPIAAALDAVGTDEAVEVSLELVSERRRIVTIVGAGRARAQDPVVHAAGIDLHVKPGAAVTAGQPLFTLLADDDKRFDRALDALEGAWEIGADAPASAPLVRERITA